MKILIKKPSETELAELNVSSWSTWSADPSTFNWYYEEREIAYVLAGKVTVKTDWEEVTFAAGDLVTFPAGLSCVWIVHEPFNKHYKFD